MKTIKLSFVYDGAIIYRSLIYTPVLLVLIALVCFTVCGASMIDHKHNIKAITDATTALRNNDNETLHGFNVTSSVVEEAIAAEDSHIKYPEFILKLMNNVRAQPNNNTLQQEYKLIQRQLDFEYGDFPMLCNIEDRNSSDRSMRDVCNSKISFIYYTCQADPTISKEACDPSNEFVNNYLKHFNPPILTNISSKQVYATLLTALQIPAPSGK
jgi:hypothetical protein